MQERRFLAIFIFSCLISIGCAEEWDCSELHTYKLVNGSTGTSPYKPDYPAFQRDCNFTFVFQLIPGIFVDLITNISINNQDEANIVNSAGAFRLSDIYNESCECHPFELRNKLTGDFNLTLDIKNGSLGGIFSFSWSAYIFKNYSEESITLEVKGALQNIPFNNMTGNNIFTVISPEPFTLAFPYNTYDPTIYSSFFYHGSMSGEFLGGLYQYGFGAQLRIDKEPFQLAVVTDFSNDFTPNYVKNCLEVLIVPIKYRDQFNGYEYVNLQCDDSTIDNPTLVPLDENDALVLNYAKHAQMLILKNTPQVEWYSGLTGPLDSALVAVFDLEKNNTDLLIPDGGATFVSRVPDSRFQLNYWKEDSNFPPNQNFVLATPLYNINMTGYLRSLVWNYSIVDYYNAASVTMDVYVHFVDSDEPNFIFKYENNSIRVGGGDQLMIYSIQDFTVTYEQDSGRGGKLEYIAYNPSLANWDCTKSILLDVRNGLGSSPFDEYYSTKSYCTFEFINVKPGTLVVLNVTFITTANDHLWISTGVGYDFLIYSGKELKYNLGTNFKLILQPATDTLRGKLTFSWTTHETQDFEKSNITIVNGKSQTIPFYSMTKSNVLTISASFPFVLLFPDIPIDPKNCSTFYYQGSLDWTGTYLGSAYNFGNGVNLMVEEEPFNLVVIIDFGTFGPNYPPGYEVQIIPKNIATQSTIYSTSTEFTSTTQITTISSGSAFHWNLFGLALLIVLKLNE